MSLLDAKHLQEYVAPVKDNLAEFDRRLSDHVRGDSPLVSSIARHLLRTRGKRIRPAFLFLSSGAANALTAESIDASLAIELIHTATLLHDDVVDESDMRRGAETVNAQWTNLISVLMGDYLFAKAFRIMVRTGSMELMQAVSQATERVSLGELRQIEETGNVELSEQEYLSIIADKTASLFTVSCETGPILKRQGPDARSRLAEFGEKVGTAFQIADDLLDYIGDPGQTGKDLGNDVLTGKMTLPLIHSMRQVGRASQKEIGGLLNDKDRDGEDIFRRVHQFVTEYGGLEYAHNKANDLAQQGLEAIANLDDTEYHTSLINLVRYTTRRAS